MGIGEIKFVNAKPATLPTHCRLITAEHTMRSRHLVAKRPAYKRRAHKQHPLPRTQNTSR
jgi:hypothetical protein